MTFPRDPKWWHRRLAETRIEWSAEDLLQRSVSAVLACRERNLEGVECFPAALQVQVRVRSGGPVEVVRGWAADPHFAVEVQMAVRNRLGRAGGDAVPPLAFVVEEGHQDEVVARGHELEVPTALVLQASTEGSEPGWSRDSLGLCPDRSSFLVGRGEWHGASELAANDLRLPESAPFVSRACFELRRVGRLLELRPTAETRKVVAVRGHNNLVRGADPATGWTRLQPGDRIELLGGEIGEKMVLEVPGTPPPAGARSYIPSGAGGPVVEDGRFAFTLAELARSQRKLDLRSLDLRSWFGGSPARVALDPLLVRRALERCLDHCHLRGPDERAIAWNVYVVHLSVAHRRTVELMVERYADSLARAVAEMLEARGMIAPEAPTILFELDQGRVLGLDELVVEPGLWSPRRVHERAARAPQHTIRGRNRSSQSPSADPRQAPRPPDFAPTPLDGSSTPSGSSAAPLSDIPSTAGMDLLVGGQVVGHLAPRRRYVLGRGPGDGSDPHHVELVGVDERIAQRHVVIRAFTDVVRIERLADAGPVEVSGEAVQAGGRFETSRLPVTLVLGGGAASLELRRPGRG